MQACPTCGHQLVRIHRTRTQKLLFSEAFHCANCGQHQRYLHPILDFNAAFFKSRYTCCVQCGNTRVRPLPARDLLERRSRHPVSQLFRLVGAPLRICPLCRLQYHDWRPIEPAAPVPVERSLQHRS